jgi:hypothetical protein
MGKSTKQFRKELKKSPRLYMAEFNRCIGDNIKNVVRALRAKGYEVGRIRHKTTVLIRRPEGLSFKNLRSDLGELAQPRIGSVILCSTSGRFWLLDNKGNSPGIFVAITGEDL